MHNWIARQTTVAVAATLLVVGGWPTRNVARAARPQEATPPKGDASAGKQLFAKVGCKSCHGIEAQGSPAGPRLAPNPMPFGAFARYVREPRGNMPPYSDKVMSDQQRADIYAFLRAQPGPSPVESLLPPLP